MVLDASSHFTEDDDFLPEFGDDVIPSSWGGEVLYESKRTYLARNRDSSVFKENQAINVIS